MMMNGLQLLFCVGMQGGKEKKLTVFTKNMQPKKPALEIDINSNDEPNKMASTHPLPHNDQTKNTNNLTSPSNFKLPQQPISMDNHEVQPFSKKALPQQQQPMQKKTSLKQAPVAVSKIQQPKPALINGFASPKAAFGKEKVLISYTSEKNLGVGVKAKEPQRDSKVAKIEELERIIEESKIKQSELSSRQQELAAEVERLHAQNAALCTDNAELKKKIEKYKISNEETKKMLKQRIYSFNEQGGEMQALKAQIKTLQQRVETLLAQNQTLKADLNRYSEYTPKGLSQLNGSMAMGMEGSMATSAVREVHLEGSRVSQLYLKQSGERHLLQFTNMENMEENLDLQSYISETEESYLEEYRTNVEIFDNIKQEYEHILKDIEIRYKAMAQDFQQAAKSQAAEIYELQGKIDELVEQRSCRPSPPLSIELDEMLLRNQREISSLSLQLFDLRSSNKELLQQIQHHRAQCRFLSAQLDIQRLKRQFKNENDKFEYNVVKLNLLSIIQKLKTQIDKEKTRYTKLQEKYQKVKPKKDSK